MLIWLRFDEANIVMVIAIVN